MMIEAEPDFLSFFGWEADMEELSLLHSSFTLGTGKQNKGWKPKFMKKKK